MMSYKSKKVISVKIKNGGLISITRRRFKMATDKAGRIKLSGHRQIGVNGFFKID